MARSVYVCGDSGIYTPECDDCTEVKSRVTALEACCESVQTTIQDHESRITTNTGNITNNSNSIATNTNAISQIRSDLANYYTKSETYTKQEVLDLIGDVEGVSIKSVATLPQTGESNVIYLVPKQGSTGDIKDEYLWVSEAWEKIGDTSIDLSDYYTKTEADTLLGNKVDKVAGKGLSTNDYTNADKAIVDGVTANLNNKVDKVTGKGLSTNDYTNAEKTKLAGIEENAEVNVQSDWNVTDSSSDAFIKNKPTIPDVSNFYTKTQVDTALGDKVDKVTGKGLSTNDYTNADKTIVSNVTTNLNNKVDKVTGKGLSTNDYTNADKAIVDGVTTALAGKQDKLTAGTNITISGNTISATDTKYTAGTNVQISASNVISATDTKYTAGSGIAITNNVISTAKTYVEQSVFDEAIQDIADVDSDQTTRITALENSLLTPVTVDITPGSEFALYDSQSVLRATKYGHVVQLYGDLKTTSNFPANMNEHVIGTLPNGFKPVAPIYSVMSGTGNAKWLLIVKTNGQITESRYADYRVTTQYGASELLTNYWLPLSTTWIV